MKKGKIYSALKHLAIRLIAYFVILLLMIFFELKGTISLISPIILILLFEIIWLQIKYKNVNILVIFREMGIKKILKTILAMVGSVVVFFSLIALTVLFIFFRLGPGPKYFEEDPRKEIFINNNTGKSVCVIINFRYTEEEITEYFINDEYFSRIDTFFLGKPHFRHNGTSMCLPINRFDSIPFPKHFKVSILDSTCTFVLRELDFDEFIAFTKDESSIENNNPLTQKEWWLPIDSIINSCNY